ncbi:alpha/beta fold hydrolase [Alteromonas sp. 5E99-2]|uniref:alpha/beta fold hydrolase n=1 Tax=Alteromonas sp. 5E99-2 TaxID=2817683 RepID=UPI001A9867ED|nr:alpha/beta fold hydrolase [Alteromonas sp. 5E99-2]MBO1254845.1 alpha/beta fold hydrolase [Alteromonas sp. 5E99-2]
MPDTINYSLSASTNSALPKVVLIHGLFGDKDNLNNLNKHLSTHFNVMSIDLPDHGKSSHLGEWTFETVVAELDALLIEKEFYPCNLVGHSLGGKVAMAMALLHPSKIEKVVVADIAPALYPPRHDSVFNALTAVQDANIESRKQGLEILNSILVEPGTAQFLLKNLKQIDNQWRWQFNVAGLKRSYSNIINWPFTSKTYHGQTLFIKGEKSNYLTQAHAQPIKQMFPNSSFKIISDTGHWLHAEKPTVFNQIVLRMLTSNT